MSLLCKIGIHNYHNVGQATKANAIDGGYIWKQRQVCSNCDATRLVVNKRVDINKKGA